ncbi:MAG: hypothetical protein IKT43_00435 [Clostridia bacterium]|nr:hypothetical protein [Clostridia bacterium]
MKRIFAFLLVLVFLLPVAVQAEESRRFYLEVLNTENEGEYRVNVRWDGATLQDEISGFRLSLAYPADLLVCKDFDMGEVMYDFGIRMGPPSVDANPAVFLGVEISHAVTESGVFATFLFEKKEGAAGEAKLTLELAELIRLDHSDARADFAVESCVINLDGDENGGLPLCMLTGVGHTLLEWQTDSEDPSRLYKYCSLCGKVVEEKTVENTSKDPLFDGSAVLAPGNNSLPQGAEIDVLPDVKALSEALFSAICQKIGTDKLTYLETIDVSIKLDGEKVNLTEKGTLTVDAPEGLADGESVCVARTEGETVLEVFALDVQGGKLEIPVSDLGTLQLLRLEESADAPITDVDVPTPPAPQKVPAEDAAKADQSTLWIVLGVAGGLCALSAVTVVLLKKKK